MDIKSKGDFAKMRQKERDLGEKNIILELLKNNSLESVSKMINKDVSEIHRIIGTD